MVKVDRIATKHRSVYKEQAGLFFRLFGRADVFWDARYQILEPFPWAIFSSMPQSSCHDSWF
jgi:hypothetical protein